MNEFKLTKQRNQTIFEIMIYLDNNNVKSINEL